MRNSLFWLGWFSSAMLVSAADWPRWRGPAGDGVVPAGQTIISAVPDDPITKWQLEIGEGFASPVVAGGKVFYLANHEKQEIAHAADAETGKALWQHPVGESHKDGFGIGPRTTPLVDGALVYFQSARGEFQARAVEDGKLVWRTNFVDDHGAVYTGEKGSAAGASRHGATGAPFVDGDKIIVQVGGLAGASIVAFEKATGKVLWKSQNDQTAYAGSIITTVSGVRQFIAFTTEALIGLDVNDGKLLWRKPLSTRLGRHVTTPVVHENVVIVASHTLGLVATRLVKSGETWQAEDAWVNAKVQTNFSSPVIVGDHLYGLGSAKDLICVAVATGEVAWAKTGIVNTSAEQAEAAFLVLGNNIGTLTDGGEFVLYKANPAAFEEIGRAQVCGKNWCNPAYVNGSLFLRDAKELRRVELKE
jgi:outer membrane protein assembly factor BamB